MREAEETLKRLKEKPVGDLENAKEEVRCNKVEELDLVSYGVQGRWNSKSRSGKPSLLLHLFFLFLCQVPPGIPFHVPAFASLGIFSSSQLRNEELAKAES